MAQSTMLESDPPKRLCYKARSVIVIVGVVVNARISDFIVAAWRFGRLR